MTPISFISKDQAGQALTELKSMDDQAIALLKQYGG